jgi:hypothetical protein
MPYTHVRSPGRSFWLFEIEGEGSSFTEGLEEDMDGQKSVKTVAPVDTVNTKGS